MDIFNSNYKDPLEPTTTNKAVKRLRKNFEYFLKEIGNTYILRKYSDTPATTADPLTGETVSGNDFKYNDYKIIGFTNHGIGSDRFSTFTEVGEFDENRLILYVKYTTPCPRAKDIIFTLKEIPNNISESKIEQRLEIMYIKVFKIIDHVIYYALYLKEVR